MAGSLLVFAIFWQILAVVLQNKYLPTPLAVFDVLLREGASGELCGSIRLRR